MRETHRVASRVRSSLRTWVRRDGLALLLFVVAIVVMTTPLAFRLGDGLPSSKGDTKSALWQKWWLSKAVAEGYNVNHTPYLFHPVGMDLTFQPHRWTALVVWQPLSVLFGEEAGYVLNFLLGLLVGAYAAYLLVLHLTSNRVAAWVGGAFFTFYPAHLLTAMYQPNTGSIQWVALFMLALVAGLRRFATTDAQRSHLSGEGFWAMVWAAVALSVNIYITVKPWTQAVVLAAAYVPLAALANGWWRRVAFWEAVAVLALLSVLLALPVVVPYLRAGDNLAYTVEQTASHLRTEGADIVSFIRAAPELPLFTPRAVARLRGVPFGDWRRRNGTSFYLGLVSIVLAVAGAYDSAKRDRRRLIWLLLALGTWLLSLGTVLFVDGVKMATVKMPYRLVDEIPLFKAVRTPNRFALGFSLPWAVLVGFGAAYLWKRLEGRKWLAYAVTGGLTALMLFELTEAPLTIYPLEISPFFYQIRDEEAQGALINLPMTGSHNYMLEQTVHGWPIAGGSIGRLPENAFAYVEANPLLKDWRQREPLSCTYDMGRAMDSLLADGFRYVVVHKAKPQDWLDGYVSVTPIYDDAFVTVYSLADWRDSPPCP